MSHKSLTLLNNMPILAHKTGNVSPEVSGYFTIVLICPFKALVRSALQHD